jgi:membrane protease YdiL (CAAX protease family)
MLDQKIDQGTDQGTDQIIDNKAQKKRGKRIRRYLKILWPLLVEVLIAILYFICFGLVTTIINASAYFVPDTGKGNIVAVYLASKLDLIMEDTMLMMIPLQLVLAAVYYRWYSKLVIINLEITKRCFQKINLRLLLLLAFGSHLFITGALNLIFPFLGKVGEEYLEITDEFFGGNFLFVLISALILAPISEELICRGIIMKKAREVFPFAVANVIQAIIFGVMHGNVIQGSYAFLLGLILGYITYRYDSILPAILMHSLINLLGAFLTFPLPVAGQILEVIFGVGIIIYAVRILGKLEIQEAMTIN